MEFYKYSIFILIFVLSNIGFAQWSSNPAVNNAICTSVNNQETPVLCSDGDNGAIIAWWDRRADVGDIYAQRLNANGTITDMHTSKILPEKFELYQNYPNPFNPTTIISYQLSVSSWVTLKVFDVLGRELATLVNEKKEAGRYNFEFRASNFGLSSGVYFYRLTASDFIKTKKLLLMK